MEPTELSPLSPTVGEVLLNAVALVHVVLVAVVVVQLLRGKMRLPHGVWGLIVLLVVPVIGPVLVLTWKSRVERYVPRTQRSDARPPARRKHTAAVPLPPLSLTVCP